MKTSQDKNFLCNSEDISDGGIGYRFNVYDKTKLLPAFVIRYQSNIQAYLNICGHQDLELDWSPGDFFNLEKKLIICSTHGALFEPITGLCVSGPCVGISLEKITVVEKNGKIFLHDHRYTVDWKVDCC